MEKIARSSQFSKNSIAKTEEGYLVTNKRSNQTYQTSLSAPRCSCRSWSKTKLPCKHMFAIIRTTEESWQSFPLGYRNSVYMTLDEVVVGDVGHTPVIMSPIPKAIESDDADDADDESETDNQQQNQQSNTLGSRKRRVETVNYRDCAELLGEIKTVMHTISDKAVSLCVYFTRK